jgi:hypothetical protein
MPTASGLWHGTLSATPRVLLRRQVYPLMVLSIYHSILVLLSACTFKPGSERHFALASELTTGHRKTVRSVAWAPSGKTLAAGSFDSTVSIWERAGGEDEDLEGGNDSGEWECVTTLEGHESECKSVAYSSDGGLLASCSRDKSVWIWEGEFVILPVLRPSSIISIALSHMILCVEHCPAI